MPIYPIRYIEWLEDKHAEGRIMLERTVSAPELRICKLVNATVLRNQLFEHSSNESEDRRRHLIYARPYADRMLEPYGTALADAVFGDNCTVSAEIEPELFGWDGRRFVPIQLHDPPHGQEELGLLLLDHYIVSGPVTYECLYTVLDTNRNKLLFFLKEMSD